MIKKGMVMLSSLFLLAACGGEEPPEVEAEDPVVEAETNPVNHIYDELVNPTTFTEEYGLQAWDDYRSIINNTQLGEVSVNLDEINGTSRTEIEAFFEANNIREDVVQDEVEISDDESIIVYRYPPLEESAMSDLASALAEMTFYFYDDSLMFSAITPGYFSIEFNDVPSADDLMLMLTVDEIRELNPQIYTIAQMQVNGDIIDQVMIPAMGTDEEGDDTLMAFYFFTRGEDILQYGFLPFELVSQDFPTSSILVFQEILPTLKEL